MPFVSNRQDPRSRAWPTDPLADEVAFPRLSEEEIADVIPFGDPCRFLRDEALVRIGDEQVSSFVILSGKMRAIDLSTGERVAFVRYERGYFTGDIEVLTQRPSMVLLEAETDLEAIRLTLPKLRLLFTQQPLLGDKFWKCFQRRRQLLLGSPFRGLTVYGPPDGRATLDAVELLFRNSVPYDWVDPEVKPLELARLAEASPRYPVIARGNDLVFQNPSRKELADHLRLRRALPARTYDVLVIGAGPAGLGSAVYAASEGLSTLVLDALGPGGQAGSTSRIENYAGFPAGIGGRDLAHLVYLQALKFGADFQVPSTVRSLARLADGSYHLTTDEGDQVKARAVIVATGVTYGSLPLDGLTSLQGPGVYYSATHVQARACLASPVHVIGGGNSAGQAAMFLSETAREVSLLVRGPDLSKMSAYLAERLAANPKVLLRFHTEAIGIRGVERIHAVHTRDNTGAIQEEATSGVFIFVGAKPATGFLPAAVTKDPQGYLLTGPDVVALRSHWSQDRPPCPTETSLPGVFAAGDCRHATAKRVAWAIGDGAAAVSAVHNYLGGSLATPAEQHCATT